MGFDDMIKYNSLVSVIVPVYNVELYVRTCVESIMSQTYRELEIILVNDGSTDASGKILDDVKQKDKRVKVIHKKNNGVSSARNAGLDLATGDFIMFIDSDDWIDERMIEKLVLVAKNHDVDIVTCGMRYLNMKGVAHEMPYDYHPLDRKLTTREASYEIIKELAYGGGSLCCRLIKRSLTLDERFIERMRVSEDQDWLFRVVKKASSMMYIPGSFYNIRIRSGSATTKSHKSDSYDIELVNKEIILWARENSMVDDAAVLNALFVRTRLQYSSAIRALCGTSELSRLKKQMKLAYKKTKRLHKAEVIKYYISLLPPGLYRFVRKWLKSIKKENS